MADLASSPLARPRGIETSAFRHGFLTLREDGARYELGSRVGLLVDYKALQPVSGALGPPSLAQPRPISTRTVDDMERRIELNVFPLI